MSTICDALVALGIAFGGVCDAPREGRAPNLPDDEKQVWVVQAPKPEQEPMAPAFPPVIITKSTPVLPPIISPPSPVAIKVAAPPPPAPPNPFRVALEAALINTSSQGYLISTIKGEALPVPAVTKIASLRPANLSLPSEALDLQPSISQERYDADSVLSSLPVDNSRILAADRYITGILETGLNSQLDSASGGQAIIQTSRDVFGYHGRNVLIPKGSRLICGYQSPGRQGDTRIAFKCTRILMGGHRAEILQLSATAGDVQGRAGVSGEVDNRFWERYGTAFLLTGISTAVKITTALASSNQEEGAFGNMANSASDELSQKLGEITASVLEQTVNLAPIVTIAQGTRVQIRPAKDWYIQKIGTNQ